MQLQTIFNRVTDYKPFVCEQASLKESLAPLSLSKLRERGWG
jgi:hypothetical protein